MQGRRLQTAGVLCLLAIGSTVSAADDRFRFNLILDGRVVTTPPSASFLEGGLGKTRYGHTPRAVQAKLAQAAFLVRFEARPDLTFSAQANLDAEHDFKHRADLIEGLLRYTPAISDTLSLDVRAGLFFPAVSLENTEPAWLSPYTTTFSAINSWIGEEVRNLGLQAGPSLRAGEAKINAFGAVTRRNDPSGTLLAWRGFALHDRVSGFSDRLPLPPLKSFDRSSLFPEQPLHVQPWREVDGEWTWSTGLAVSHPKYRLKALYQAPTADPGVFDGEQYAWRTGYWSLGLARSFGPVELLAQGLDGETRMGRVPQNRNAVVARFRSAYGMASWATLDARHRTTVRFDTFQVRDRDDFVIEDANDESGTAWTFAYAFSPTPRGRITAELLRLGSTRTNRVDLGLQPHAVEILGTLSLRLTF